MSTVPAQTIEGRRRIKAARAKKCEHTVVKDGQPGVCDRPIVDTVDEVCDRPGDHEETHTPMNKESAPSTDEPKVMILTYHEWQCLWCRDWNGVTDDVSTGDTVKCATCYKLSRAEWPS